MEYMGQLQDHHNPDWIPKDIPGIHSRKVHAAVPVSQLFFASPKFGSIFSGNHLRVHIWFSAVDFADIFDISRTGLCVYTCTCTVATSNALFLQWKSMDCCDRRYLHFPCIQVDRKKFHRVLHGNLVIRWLQQVQCRI